jgi:hypothetical protein
MRWKTHYRGDTRIIKKFLILPLCINHEVRWFEWVEIKQWYDPYYPKPWRNSNFISS